MRIPFFPFVTKQRSPRLLHPYTDVVATRRDRRALVQTASDQALEGLDARPPPVMPLRHDALPVAKEREEVPRPRQPDPDLLRVPLGRLVVPVLPEQVCELETLTVRDASVRPLFP